MNRGDFASSASASRIWRMATLSTASVTNVSCQTVRIRWSFVTSSPGRETRCSRTANALGRSLMTREPSASLIERALGNLPDRYRELIVLREMEGLSYQDSPTSWTFPSERSCQASRARATHCESLWKWSSRSLTRKAAPREPHASRSRSLSRDARGDGNDYPDTGSFLFFVIASAFLVFGFWFSVPPPEATENQKPLTGLRT